MAFSLHLLQHFFFRKLFSFYPLCFDGKIEKNQPTIFYFKNCQNAMRFVLFSSYPLSFDEKNSQKYFKVQNIRQIAVILFCLAIIHFVLTKKIVAKNILPKKLS